MGLFTVKFTAQRIHRFISVNLVDFLQGVGEASYVSCYLSNVGSLFHANEGSMFEKCKNCFLKEARPSANKL